MRNKLMRSDEEKGVLASFKAHVYVALGGMVIPSLRCVGLNWEPGVEKAQLVFYHDGIVDEPIYWHYDCIEAEATCFRTPKYKGVFVESMEPKMVSLPYPKPLPPSSEIIYLRKEKLSDFYGVDEYLPPNWGVTSIIHLKINEALRGKVTGNLRSIYLTWNSSHTEGLITFFHNEDITDEVKKDYEAIFKIARVTSHSWQHEGQPVHVNLTVSKLVYPEKIPVPEGVHILYSRKEPFTDLPIGEE